MPAFFLYGLLLGVSQTAATLLVFALGLHREGADLGRAQFIESLAGFILMIVVVALGLRAARQQREARGEASGFGAGARSALGLALVGALFAGLGQAAYLAWINPGFATVLRDSILAGAAEQLAALPPADAEEARRNVGLAVSPAARGLAQGISTFLFATIVGLAFAVVLRAAIRREAATQTPPGA